MTSRMKPEPDVVGLDASSQCSISTIRTVFGWVIKVFDDPVGLPPAPLVVEVLCEWQPYPDDMLSIFHHPLLSPKVEGSSSAIPGDEAASHDTPDVVGVDVGYPGVHAEFAEDDQLIFAVLFVI